MHFHYFIIDYTLSISIYTKSVILALNMTSLTLNEWRNDIGPMTTVGSQR